ncbi:hypothetical protein [Noviherbaspirillum suwonense]|uniref:hypothetical protein n=1 Tax=Noviherbaspirillum suwonense TaxID=1224511 RepID=UPI0024B7E094|nr:hypothetical protein [Noviherbaspirillum suwonense]
MIMMESLSATCDKVLPAALAVLLFLGIEQWVVAAFCDLYGFNNGILTIVRGTVPQKALWTRELRRDSRRSGRPTVDGAGCRPARHCGAGGGRGIVESRVRNIADYFFGFGGILLCCGSKTGGPMLMDMAQHRCHCCRSSGG